MLALQLLQRDVVLTAAVCIRWLLFCFYIAAAVSGAALLSYAKMCKHAS